MISSNRKVVRIGQESEKKVLSKAQKQFNNLIKKIDTEKKRLLEWQETIPEYNRKISHEYDALWDTYNAERAELAQLLDRACENKLFKKTDKKKLSHIISEITAALVGDHGKEELKDLHDKHSDIGFDAAKQEADAMAGEFMKSMVQDMFGIDIGDDVDISSPEKMESLLQEIKEKDAEIRRQAEERRATRKKTAKQLEKEAKQQQEEQNISQSIREVYRKLTTALHPDREQDAAERERKTEIMQRVNIAYAKKDLLGLLELQLEAEQIDADHLRNIAEDRLKYFNKILKEQLDELQQEIAQIEHPFKLQLNFPPYMTLSPKHLMQHLEQDIRGVKQDISRLREDIRLFRDDAALKAWLKNYKIPKQSEIDDFDALFFGGFEPPFGYK